MRDVAFGSNPEVGPLERHVRSTLKSRHRQATPACPKGAKKRLMHCTNFERNAGTHLHDTHRAVEEPSTPSMADIGNSLQCGAPTPFTWPSKAIRSAT